MKQSDETCYNMARFVYKVSYKTKNERFVINEFLYSKQMNIIDYYLIIRLFDYYYSIVSIYFLTIYQK